MLLVSSGIRSFKTPKHAFGSPSQRRRVSAFISSPFGLYTRGCFGQGKRIANFLQKIQIFPDEKIEPEKKHLFVPTITPTPLQYFVFIRVESLAEPLHKLGPLSAAQDPPPLLNKRALLFSHGWEDTHKRFSKGGG